MRTAICEDEKSELDRLMKLLRKYETRNGLSLSCFAFHNGTDFLHDMKGGEYDLVILDVLMPGINGIQVAQELRRLDKNVKLIFMSSSSDFAVESYSVGASGYLLKPSNADSLFPLLDKVRSELYVQDKEDMILKNREGVMAISFAQLEYIEVIKKKVFFHLSDNVVHEVTSTLSECEKKLLERPEFFKSHRSYIINLNHVKTIGANCAVMKSGHNIPVSRLQHGLLKDAFTHFVLPQKAGAGVPDRSAEAAEKSGSQKEPWPSKGPWRHEGSWRILLVDDDPADRTFWANVLQLHGCVVQTAGNGAEALKSVSNASYDCVLLDVMIPGEDGFAVCEKLRKIMSAPVIFLSSLTESDKQLEGFSAGGIDYITKNTPSDLFWAKVETRLRLSASNRTQLCFGSLLIDLTQRKVLIGREELSLSPIEFDILLRFAERPGHIFTPEEISGGIWIGQPWDEEQAVHMHVSKLRRKLEKASEKHSFIEAVWGQGYRFVLQTDESTE